MLKELIQLANRLDDKGFRKEADHLDRIITKLSSEDDGPRELSTPIDFGDQREFDFLTGEGLDYEDPIQGLSAKSEEEMKQDEVWAKIQGLILEHNMREDELLRLVIERAQGPYSNEVREELDATDNVMSDEMPEDDLSNSVMPSDLPSSLMPSDFI